MAISRTKSVTLTWSQSSFDVVNNYLISYRRIAGCTNALSGSHMISGSLRMYTVIGLEDNITYEINVTAMSTGNSSSVLINATTLSAGLHLMQFHVYFRPCLTSFHLIFK